MDGEEYLTVGEAVKRFADQGLTETKLRWWIKTERVEPFEREFDGVTVVKASDVLKVIASQKRIIPKERA